MAPPDLLPRQTASGVTPLTTSGTIPASTPTRPPVALTTIFSPPSSCLDTVTYDGTTLWQNGLSQLGDPACYPSSFHDIIFSFYSPGICPQQWTSAGTISHASGFDAMCCPRRVDSISPWERRPFR